jgi:hypothetical protein
MKKQKRNGQGLYLKTRNNRWKRMASAAAVGMTASQAGAITISLVNNSISAAGGNHLNADLTGDGHPDLTIANAGYYSRYYKPFARATFAAASVRLNSIYALAISSTAYRRFGRRSERLGSQIKYWYPGYTPSDTLLTGSIPIFFKDLHINGGAPTSGLLEVTVSAYGARVQLDSFSYTSNTLDHASSLSVPEQGSSLALLAMGAGGILALRRWRAAQKSA